MEQKRMKKPASRTDHTPPDTILTPDRLIFRVVLPPAYLHTDFRRDLAYIRTLAPKDPERAARLAEAIEHYREIVSHEWHSQGKNSVLHGLAEGNPRSFFRFEHDYGPRGLALLLTDEEILEHVESWWIESILGDKACRQNSSRIGEELARAGSRGAKKKFPPEEATQRKRAQDREAKCRFRARRKKKIR
jgi:hypothetical protein